MAALTQPAGAQVRVVAAIAAKDIAEAVKNRRLLAGLLSMLFVILLYRFLPLLSGDTNQMNILVYEAGNEQAVIEALDTNNSLSVYPMPSADVMRERLGGGELPELGLVVPAIAAGIIGTGQPLEMEGYVLHWVTAREAQALRNQAEQTLTEQLGQPVIINLDENVVYAREGSFGRSFLAAASLVIVLITVGLTLCANLILDEKMDKTMDVLLVSPASYAQVVAGKALVGMVYCLAAAAIVAAMNLTLITQWWLFGLAVLVGSAFGVGLGLLMGTLLEVRAQLMVWTMILAQPLLLPVFLVIMDDLLPPLAITIMRWVPATALSRLLEVSFSNQGALGAFGPELLYVALWAVGIFVAVIWLVSRMER